LVTAAAALAGAPFLAPGAALGGLAARVFFTAALAGAVFFGDVFLVVPFFEPVFLAVVFLVVVLFAVAFFAVAFLAVFFTALFLTVFFAAVFFVPVRLAAGFLAAARFGPLAPARRPVALRRPTGFLAAVPGISVSLGPRGA